MTQNLKRSLAGAFRVVFLAHCLVVFSAQAELFDTHKKFTDGSGQYTAARRKLHDEIVDKILQQGTTSENPNLIFTAGAPGAGKSTAIGALSAAGYIDTSKYLLVDPDEIKKFIPEYEEFKKVDSAQAANLVHMESGIIQELLFKKAIQQKKNVIVDGTLRATDYFAGLINDVKKSRPEYSTSIVLVDADQKTLLDRVAARAKATGRHVPESYVIDTKRVVRESVAKLRNLTDSAIEISNETTPIITSFFKNGENVTVNLKVPLKGSGILVDYQLEVPSERLAIDKSVGTMDQIKGNKRVIEISSGPHLDPDRLKSEFLSKLDPSQHWVVVKAEDPQASTLIRIAREAGFETISMGVAAKPAGKGGELPTFYVVASDEGERSRMWQGLVTQDDENKADHISLDYSRPLEKRLDAMADSMNQSRAKTQAQLKGDLHERAIPLLSASELKTELLKGRTPILFSGASKKSWPLISEANQREVIKSIQDALSVLDPKKVVIVTGATDYGVEKIVHEEARKRGFTILGTVVESAKAGEVGPVTHTTIMESSWYGKSRPVLQLVKDQGGTVIFMGGGEILKDEIQMAKDLGVRFHLMDGPEGAANEVAKTNPDRAFKGGDGLTGTLYKEHGNVIEPDKTRVARDAMFRDFQRTLKNGPTEELSYNQLLAKARGYKVTVLGGYSGLGYENPEVARAYVRDLMKKTGDNSMYVIGGTSDGLGQAYQWIPEIAAELGFRNVKTAGIVSRNAAQYGISPQDYVVFVDTGVNDWEVKSNGKSLMVGIAHDTDGQMVYLKGGGVTEAELGEALQRGVKVTIINDPKLAPDPKKVAKKLISTPNLVVDGTEKFAKEAGKYATLRIAAPGEWQRASVKPAQATHGTTPEAQITKFFQEKGKRVVTFIGYSGAEYEDKPAMLKEARRILGGLDPKTTLINIGATPEGIGALYGMAKELGFETTGIVSAEALKYKAATSPAVDHVFYVDDATWGGFTNGTDRLSPTSRSMIGNSDEVYVIGGGEVGADEARAAKMAGKKVTFIPADMNHALATAKAEKKGLPAPTDFRGAAHIALAPPIASEEEIAGYFKGRGKKVVTFIGYSGAEYEDKPAMLNKARRILERLDPKSTIINIGATPDGIGSVYQLAKRMGFETTGIVSSQAQQYGVSPYVDRVFFVQDASWGGYLPGTHDLSPTSRAMVNQSDQVIAIGGGDVGFAEFITAQSQGKPTAFIPAEMNREKAIKKAAKGGLPVPTDFRGPAHLNLEAQGALSHHGSRTFGDCLAGLERLGMKQ